MASANSLNNLAERISALSPEQRALFEKQLRARRQKSLVLQSITPRRQGDSCPLSLEQEHLWFLDQLEPNSFAYNLSSSYQLVGSLNLAALEQCFNEVIRRHEALRTTFASTEGRPRQVIASSLTLTIPLIDLTSIVEIERAPYLKRLITASSQMPFDLSAGPMIRATLFKLSDTEHRLVMTLHHIVTDRWSFSLLWRELMLLYDAFSKGLPSPLPELPVQFPDFALWQRDWLEGEVLEKRLSYWKKQLAGASFVFDLPSDRPRPANQTFIGKRQYRIQSKELWSRLKALCHQENTTLFMTLLAAYYVLLYRYTGQRDIVVGTPYANRNRVETEGIIGYLLNMLVLRMDMSGNPTFLELLRRVRAMSTEAYANNELPFAKLIEELQPERDLSRNPLFQVTFVFVDFPEPSVNLPELALKQVDLDMGSSIVDMMLGIRDQAEPILIFEYNVDLFDDATITRMMIHYETLLESIVSDPCQRLSALLIVPNEERIKLLEQWNKTSRAYPRDLCAHELFELQVTLTPDATAVSFEDLELSYAELNARANQVARELRARGVGPEVLVGLLMERSIEMVIGLLGILKAGGGYVPLDPSYPAERLSFIVNDAAVSLVVTQQVLLENLSTQEAAVLCLDSAWPDIARHSIDNLPNLASADNIAYVIYTSGSTGQPKGVQVCQRSLTNCLSSIQREPGLSATDVVLAITNLSFDIATLELLLPLISGARLVVGSRVLALDGEQLAAKLDEDEVTTLQATPATWRLLIESGWQGRPGLKVLSGGEALGRELADALAMRSATVWNLYGPSETTIYSAGTSVQQDAGAVTIGRGIANTQLYVLDEQQNVLPGGVIGELYIGGDGLGRGYRRRPDLTAEKFIPNPFSSEAGARLYRTGDLVRYSPEGKLEFLGRIDHQIKLRGFRIELGEIEAVLAKHPAVRACVVVAREDVPGDKRLVAYVVADREISVDQWRSHLQQKLPEYMLPSSFVVIEKLPLTPNGKVDRRALPSPDRSAGGQTKQFVTPRTPVQEILADIWRDILRVKEVGIYDSFFELGGHSLLATQVMSRVRDAFQIELPLRRLFETPTIEALAGSVESAISSGQLPASMAIVRASRDEDLPLSFPQQRLWLLDKLEPNNSTYNLHTAVRLRGKFDVEALEQALTRLIERHESLRTNFVVRGGEPVQVVADPTAMRLEVLDLCETEEPTSGAELSRIAKHEAQRPFALSSEPLLRVKVVQIASDEHVVLITMHHIIGDGWSIEILIREMAKLYEASVNGEPALLPELPVQYADFAASQRRWLRGEALDAHLTYWKRQLSGVLPVLDLPLDHVRPPVQTFHGAYQLLTLSKETTGELKTLSQSRGATMFMTLLSAFTLLLHHYSAQEDIIVGSPIAGRNRAEIESVIGCFLNILVLRTDLSGSPSFAELLRRVREVSLAAYSHQDVPFEKLIEELQPARDLTRTPLFQVFFNMLSFPLGEIALPGLTAQPLRAAEAWSKFDLTLYAREQEARTQFRLVYNAALFSEARMAELLRQFEQLLAQVVEQPEASIDSFSLVTETSKRLLPSPVTELRAEWKGAVHSRFSEQAQRRPEKLACVSQGESWTYGELEGRSNQVANYWRDQGIEAEETIAIYGQRSALLVCSLLGVLKAGASFVLLDPAYPAARNIAYLEIAKPAGWLQLDAALPQELDNFIKRFPSHRQLVISHPEVLNGYSTATPEVEVGPNDSSYIAFTSGSTGKPKAVAGEHQPLSHFLHWYEQTFALEETERFSMLTAVSHDPFLRDVFAPLWLGATLCIPEPEEMGQPGALHEWLEREKITVTHMAPAMTQLLTGKATLSSLRYVFFHGDLLTEREVEKVQRIAPNVTCVNFYGATETPQAMGYFVVPRLANTDSFSRRIPIGHGIRNVQLLVLNRSGQSCGTGELGELYIRTPYLTRGYVGEQALSREHFLSNPFSGLAEDRLYRTGDLGRYLPGGEVEFAGRADQQLKIRGYRVEPGEIEAVLLGHQAITAAAVMGRKHGADEQRLVAYIVAGKDTCPSSEELRRYLSARLPDYMLPSAFVRLDGLPLTPHGKLDQSALPEPDSGLQETGYVASRTPVEEILVNIWAQVLGVERIGIHDNFFELGGHSLLATRLVSCVRDSFHVELPLRSLFESPTVARLGKCIEMGLTSSPDSAVPPLKRVERIGPLPLSFSQQRLWILNKIEAASSIFNMHQAIRLKGVLDIAALEQSLNVVLKRHESLHTRFVSVDGLPAQVVEPPSNFILSPLDLTALSREEKERKVLELNDKEAHHIFDLAQPPLFRISLLKLESEEHVVLLTMHHIISDGWSMGILIRETSELYAAFSEGKELTLPYLPIQYSDFAVWQRDWRDEVLEAKLSYWKRHLDGAPPAIKLPLDHPRPLTSSSRGARYSVTMPATLLEELTALGRNQGMTVFIILLAALKILLCKWTGQRDLVTGTVIANRNQTELENVIGCFMNFLPIRAEILAEETGLQFLERIKAAVLEMYAQQDCPFEKIVEAVNPERRPNQNPLYNVAFLLQNFPRAYAFSPTLEASMIPSANDSSLLDLRLIAEEYAGEMKLWCEYRNDLFEPETVEQLLENYRATLEKLVSEPQASLSSFAISEGLQIQAKRARAEQQDQTLAIAATFTAEPVEDSLAFWMQQLDIPIKCEFAPFNQIFQQLLQPSSLLATNENGVNVILIRLEDLGRRLHNTITEQHSLNISPPEVERNVLDFLRALATATGSSSTPYLICICPSSPDVLAKTQTAGFFAQIEELMTEKLKDSNGVYLVTTSELNSTYPVAQYYDVYRDQLGQVPYTSAFFTALGMMIARKVRALKSPPYKVIVLDCDETLWKGVCGEDGPLGIEVDAPRRALQEFILSQHDQGMLLCLCSQNNEEDVLEVFRQHSDMLLKQEHFAAARINWRPKSENIRALAEELQLALDSVIFIDNDPVVCMQVQANCPEVLTLQLPASADDIPRFLRHVWAFDRLKITETDRQRTAFYQQNQNRERLRNNSWSLDHFLEALELNVQISEMSSHQLARVAQLTQRTNQFNVTGIKRSESELEQLCLTGRLETLVVDAKDRFGDYGLVGVMIFGSDSEAINVDTFLLSCRALGRRLEHRMLTKLGTIARERGKPYVNLSLRRTTKNQPAFDFLSQAGSQFGELNNGGWIFKFPTEHLLSLGALGQ